MKLKVEFTFDFNELSKEEIQKAMRNIKYPDNVIDALIDMKVEFDGESGKK